MKQNVIYEISYSGTRAECNKFEKLLDSMRTTIEDMHEWDEINDEDNPPAGIRLWSKKKYLKHSVFPMTRKNQPANPYTE